MNTLKIIRPVKGLGTTLLLTLLIQFSVSCTKEKSEPMMTNEVTDAPAFTLKSPDGADVSLSDYAGKVVVLFFFGNNCPSCKAAAPDVESMLNIHFASYNDYVILGLDQWNGNETLVEAFKTATGVTFPLLLNAAATATAYNTTYDRLVVIDKSGKIVFSGKQSAAGDIATVKQKVEMLVTPPENNENKAPDFTLTSLQGSQVKLSDYSNKVVLLFFLGYNCPYCKAAVPSIETNLITPFASRTDYAFLGLDQWNGNSAAVESFRTSTGATFTLLLNASAVATLYNTTYDRFVLIDKSGNIIFKGSQMAANDISTVKTKIDSELNK